MCVFGKKGISNMSARFRRCSPCNIFITPDDTHDLCVICLGAEHTLSALKGAGCAHCDHFTVKKLHLELAEELETGLSLSLSVALFDTGTVEVVAICSLCTCI